ncbi:S-adenosyl-L-methionine-dependent methyltransferase [Globomyces pollinis-pini]|nr:S-adenosyl-L-methionine-dependent methyltransferase [Globomyces pollinis-pini]
MTKLRLGNLGKFICRKDVEKLLKSYALTPKKVKCIPKKDFAVVEFESNDELRAAMEKLSNQTYKEKLMTVKVEKAIVRDTSGQSHVREWVDDGRTPDEKIQDQVTPLWRESYENQLESKKQNVVSLVKKLTNELRKFFPKRNFNSNLDPDVEALPLLERISKMTSEQRALYQLNYLKSEAKQNNGLITSVSDILASPTVNGYRNKCEFSFGYDLEGNKTIGFLLGCFKEGMTTVLSPQVCLHVSPQAKLISNILQEFIRSSPYNPYDKFTKTGTFRIALVRTQSTDQNLVALQIDPEGLSDAEREKLKTDFKTFVLAESISKGCPIHSLHWQETSDVFLGFKEGVKMELLDGTPTITENLLGLSFEISPGAFFQVNTKGAEVLYSTIGQISQTHAQLALKEDAQNDAKASSGASSPGVILLDLCCGTGTIGISLAPYVKKVIGIEMCESAVIDARKNAEANGLKNIEFFAGKVEDMIHGVFKSSVSPNDKVIAVLDPPRAGLHHSVIKNIRAYSSLKHIVFVACDMQNSMQNLVDLCRPTSGKFKGLAFKPTKVIPVDLFPHTNHCEIIIEMERYNPEADDSPLDE